jgi:diguanylate cyclase (GGDEF)-like protein
MADRPTTGWRSDRQVPAPASRPELTADVERLGEALKARVADVCELTTARAKRPNVDPALQENVERVCNSSTIAVGRWLAGEGADVAREAGTETWLFYGELAAHRTVSLNEVITHCLCWREAVADVLQESAVQLDVPSDALSQALHILQVGVDFGFLQMSKSFDTERTRTNEELAFVATHDELTGLPNRTLIMDRTEQMLVRARRHKTPVAALFIGLDNFKNVNETLSHGAGDELLRAVAERLDDVVRDTDALGRLGGDEFVVIAEELSLQEGPERIAERLQEALKEPFTLTGEHTAELIVTASIGIAPSPQASAEKFLRDADIAMYQAKWDGKNRHVVFEPGMQDAVKRRMELEKDLREALPNDEFFLVYQPTFNLRDMRPTGVEALIRWKHPTRGVVQPNDFIPLLEQTGLIVEVGAWVLTEACRQGSTWRRAGYQIGIAVNVSARQLDTDQFIAEVTNALAATGLDADALTVEITETTLMRNVEETARRLTAIREQGVRVAIDDFGTGYSSLSHLQRFPVDALKIDRSFISRLTENADGESLVHTLVQLGKALSIETLAEGIEEQQELSMLQEEQCDSGQGFLYARPMDAAAAETFLRASASGAAPTPAPAVQPSRRHAAAAQGA